MNPILATISIAVLIIGLVSVSQAQAREPVRETYPPYYAKGPYYTKVTIRLDTDCWNKVKARFTPHLDQNILLNKQYFYNHAPGVSHWTKITTTMKFSAERLSDGIMRGICNCG